MANTTLSRLGIAAGDRTKWTFSAWVKRSGLGSDAQHIFSGNSERTGGSNYTSFYFDNDQLRYYDYYNSGIQNTFTTNAKYRDVNGFYHLVLAYDSTQSTASNRVKLYVNGEQVTSFAATSYPGPSEGSFMNVSGNDNYIGNQTTSGGYPFSGSMSHIHFIDGTAYDASAFGETDATTGEWEAKTSPSVTYGTNGFFILKDGNGITDQSGEGNDFTLGGGTLTDLKDNPDNVFATMNPLDNYYQGSTFSNGNNTVVSGSSSTTFNTSTLMMTSGKYYVEVKPTAGSATSQIGVTGRLAVNATSTLAVTTSAVGYLDSGSVWGSNSNQGGTWSTYSNNDIIGIAVDCDNNKLYFSKNGVWQNSGVPTSGSTGTGAISLTAPSSTTNGAYAFAMNETWNDNTRTWQWNFGNGYFGTTAVASAGTNASGIGIFEYDVPTGYTALSTKGLNL